MRVTTVLVVDDDPAVRQYIGDILELEGHTVRTASDGYQALREIDAERPDCVLLDIMMPGMSGLEVLTTVRQTAAGADLPIVIITAAAETEYAWQAWDAGADFFLAKPFDADQLLHYLDYLFASLKE